MSELKQKIDEAVKAIRARTAIAPLAGIIFGTGMGAMADTFEGKLKIPYEEIPHFPLSTVESHAGNLVFGYLEGKPVVAMQGRFHRYEGYTLQQVTFPARVMKALGCRYLIITNAVGSMNPLIPSGSLVLISDHINLMGDNPLIGLNDEALGPRFPDMSKPYSCEMIELAEKAALENKIRIHRGVAVAVTGPCFETAAEYRFFQRIGADIVTMSTVPEVIVAVQGGLKVLGLSTVTDACLPDALLPLTSEEVIKISNSLEESRQKIIRGVVKGLQ
jgi:purine-nucleoside phosphorylase